jgi:hypothetical protein
MDRKCQHAIEALEISGNYLKCQKCNLLVPMVGKFPRPHSDRIVGKIRYAERYYDNNSTYKKGTQEEPADLLKQEAKCEKLRSFPLCSSKSTSPKI